MSEPFSWSDSTSPTSSLLPSAHPSPLSVRQVTTIQMYQILALTCLISSYSLSVLHLDGVKYGDYQVRALTTES